jgi:hypothetical protein
MASGLAFTTIPVDLRMKSYWEHLHAKGRLVFMDRMGKRWSWEKPGRLLMFMHDHSCRKRIIVFNVNSEIGRVKCIAKWRKAQGAGQKAKIAPKTPVYLVP